MVKLPWDTSEEACLTILTCAVEVTAILPLVSHWIISAFVDTSAACHNDTGNSIDHVVIYAAFNIISIKPFPNKKF